jgi:hypothetical protein
MLAYVRSSQLDVQSQPLPLCQLAPRVRQPSFSLCESQPWQALVAWSKRNVPECRQQGSHLLMFEEYHS